MKSEQVYDQILGMFDELNTELERADRERSVLKARVDGQPTMDTINEAMNTRLGDLRAGIISDLHRMNAENKAGFRAELVGVLTEMLPAMVKTDLDRRDAEKREKSEARWTKIRNRAQTIIAVISVTTAAWALLELFARGHS